MDNNYGDAMSKLRERAALAAQTKNERAAELLLDDSGLTLLEMIKNKQEVIRFKAGTFGKAVELFSYFNDGRYGHWRYKGTITEGGETYDRWERSGITSLV
jgi:hypothetical protein